MGKRGPKPKSGLERFLSMIVKPDGDDGCWIWNASYGSTGYGQMYLNGKLMGAHRAAYILFNDEIPEMPGFHGGCVCHACDNRACVNPAHLFVGTIADNNIDRATKGRSGGWAKDRSAQRGPNHPRAKLNQDQVDEIRNILNSGLFNQKEVARAYDVSPCTVSSIYRGVTYA